MANMVYIRPYDKDTDAKLLVEWLYAGRESNLFDPEIFRRGQAVIFTAFDDSGIIGFIPVVLCYLVESLAFKPGLPSVTEMKALVAFQHVLVHKALEQNVPDTFCVTLNEDLLRHMERYGWRPAVAPLRNLHFADLERKDKENPDAGDDKS